MCCALACGATLARAAAPVNAPPMNVAPAGTLAPLPQVPPEDTVPLVPAPVSPAPAELPPALPAPALPEPAPQPPAEPTQVAAVPPAVPPIRGLWVDAFGPGLKTPAQVRQMVQDARGLGVNVLIVQAIRRGDCLCNKAAVPRVTDADLAPGFDPLAETVRLAHAAGLRVIAWVSITGAWNAKVPNTDKQYVFTQHGPVAKGLQNWLALRRDGSWRLGDDAWLDPGHPQAAEFMAQAALSLVRNYDIDGLQLDRIRYPDVFPAGSPAWGYNPVVLARYRAETGANGTPAATDPRWLDWKRQQVTNLVRRISLEGKTLRGRLWISAATITYKAAPADLAAFKSTRTYAEVLQDWPGWMAQGLLDLNVMMNYKTEATPEQAGWFDGWNAFAHAQDAATGALSAAGSAMYLNPPEATGSQASRARQAGLSWVGYSYRTPSLAAYRAGVSQPAALQTVRAALAPLPAPGAWTANPVPARALFGRVVGAQVPGNRTVQAYQDGRLIATASTDANGYYGFTRLPEGRIEVRVGGQAWRETVRAGRVVRLPDFLLRDVGRLGSAAP